MRSSAILQRTCACGTHAPGGGECEECKKKRLQRQATGAHTPNVAPPIVHDVLLAPGQPLDAGTRAFMEPRFGHDFSRVRVHTDPAAAASARAVGALAYTVGPHIAFGTGQYAPGTSAGQRLLAHELTHTIQQDGATIGLQRLAIDESPSMHERAATAIANQVMDRTVGRNASTVLQQVDVPMIQRQGDMLAQTSSDCASTVPLPMSGLARSFTGEVFSPSFRGAGSPSATINANGDYDTPQAPWVIGHENYSVQLMQCRSFIWDTEVGAKEVAVIGSPIRFTRTLPGAGFFANDAYYLRIRNSSSSNAITVSFDIS